MTLVETVLVLVILGTVVAIVQPSVRDATERARVARAIQEIQMLQIDIGLDDPLPASLAEIGRAGYLDPWGRPYVYLSFEVGGKGKGGPPAGARKDRFLVPINSRYDLCSMGADGASKAPLTAQVSHDDVIRAGDGSFIGLAARF
jgi:general secretion pathway protein G